jgi:hypothetical protein
VERNVVTHSEFCRDPEKKKCSARNLSEPSACCNTYATHNISRITSCTPVDKILPGKPENSFGIPHSNQSLLTGITLVYSNPENTGRCLFNWSFRLLHKFDSRMQVEIFDHKIEPSRVLASKIYIVGQASI